MIDEEVRSRAENELDVIRRVLASSKRRIESKNDASTRSSSIRDSRSSRDSKGSVLGDYASSRTSVGSSLSPNPKQALETSYWPRKSTSQYVSPSSSMLSSLRHTRKKENLRMEFQSLLDEETNDEGPDTILAAFRRAKAGFLGQVETLDEDQTNNRYRISSKALSLRAECRPCSPSELEHHSREDATSNLTHSRSFDDITNKISTLQVDGYDFVSGCPNLSRQASAERSMRSFGGVFDQQSSSNITHHTGESFSGSGSRGSSAIGIGTSSSTSNQRKRQRSEDEGHREDNGDRNNQSRRQSLVSGPEVEKGLKFACPFRKHDPHTYNILSNRVCALSSWGTISRLKYERPFPLLLTI